MDAPAAVARSASVLLPETSRDAEHWLIDVVVETVCSYLPPAAIARLGCVSRTLHWQVLRSEDAQRLWPQRFAAAFARPLVAGPGDFGLSFAQLFARKALRKALRAPPSMCELGVGAGAEASRAPTPAPVPRRAMRFVALTPSVAVATSEAGAAVAWLPLLRRAVLPPSARGDVFAAAASSKARRDAKAKYTGTGGGNKLLFFKIAARNRDEGSLEIWADGEGESEAGVGVGVGGSGGGNGVDDDSRGASPSSASECSSPPVSDDTAVGSHAMPHWALDGGDGGSDGSRASGRLRGGSGDGGSAAPQRPKGKDLWSSADRAKRAGRESARLARQESKDKAAAAAAAAAATANRARLSSIESATSELGRLAVSGRAVFTSVCGEGDAGMASAAPAAPPAPSALPPPLGVSLSFEDDSAAGGVPPAHAFAELLLASARASPRGSLTRQLSASGSDGAGSRCSSARESRCSSAASLADCEVGEGGSCSDDGRGLSEPPDACAGGAGSGGEEDKAAQFSRRRASRKMRRALDEARRGKGGGRGSQQQSAPAQAPSAQAPPALARLASDASAASSNRTSVRHLAAAGSGGSEGRRSPHTTSSAAAAAGALQVPLQSPPPPALASTPSCSSAGGSRGAGGKHLLRSAGPPSPVAGGASGDPPPDGAPLRDTLAPRAPPEVSFACHWVTQQPKLVRVWAAEGGVEPLQPRAAPPRSLGSGHSAALHAVLSFSDGSLGVVSPQPISPHPGDVALDGGGGVVDTLHLAQPRTRGAKRDGGAVAVPHWAPRGVVWLERPPAELREPIVGVCVARGLPYARLPLPGEADCGGRALLRKASIGAATDGVGAPAVAVVSGVEHDLIFGAFGRAVGVWLHPPPGGALGDASGGGGGDAAPSAAAPPDASPSGSKKLQRRQQAAPQSPPLRPQSPSALPAPPLGSPAPLSPPLGAAVAADADAALPVRSLKPLAVARLHAHLVTCVACHRATAPRPAPGRPVPPALPGERIGAFSGVLLRDGDCVTVVSGDAAGEIIAWQGSGGADAGSVRLYSLSLSGGAGGSDRVGSGRGGPRSAFSPLSGGGTASARDRGTSLLALSPPPPGALASAPSRSEGVACVAISDTHVVAGGSEGTVCIWRRRFFAGASEAPPELLLREARAHAIVRALFLGGGCSSAPAAGAVHPPLALTAPPPSTCVTGGGEGDVRQWTLPAPPSDGAPRGPAPVECRVLRGHTGRITGIAADLCKVVTASLDGSVRVWDAVVGGAPLHTLRFPPAPGASPVLGVSSLAVNGDALLAGLVDGRVFHIELGTSAARAAALESAAASAAAAGAAAAPPPAALFEGRGFLGGASSRDLRVALRGHKGADAHGDELSPLALQRAYDEL